MWFSLIMVLVLLAVTYFQAIQGLTSAIISGVLTAVSAGIAFGTYEYVADAALKGFAPDFAHAIAFLGMFVVPLGISRLVLDSIMPRSPQLPHLIDRIGAGIVGFFTAFLGTGMLAIALQMVPWPSVLGWGRFNHAKPAEQKEMWFRMDRAAASYGSAVADGVFGSGNSYSADHPDLVSELGWLQAGIVGVRRSAPEDAVTFQSATEIPTVYDAKGGGGPSTPVTFEPVEPAPGKKFLRVTLKIGGDNEKLQDPDNRQRYVPAAVRLVGVNGERPEIYPGMAIPDEDQPNYFVRSWEEAGRKTDVRYASGQSMYLPSTNVIEVVFEVPKGFQPRTVKYKFGGEAPFRGATASAPPPAPTPAPTPTPTPTVGGRISGVKIIFGGSHFGADLPVVMTAYSGSADVRNGTMSEGAISGLTAEQGQSQQGSEIRSFEVPEGKALLHLNVESLKAGSLYGKAMNFAAQTVENYILEDDRGNQLTPVGKYAVAMIGNDEVIEIQYFPQIGGRVKPFERIKSAHLQKDYQLVYLYLLDSGAKAMKFSPGGNLRPTELAGENLVAP